MLRVSFRPVPESTPDRCIESSTAFREDVELPNRRDDLIFAAAIAEPSTGAAMGDKCPFLITGHCDFRDRADAARGWTLPTEATTVGWDSYPPGICAFHGAR